MVFPEPTAQLTPRWRRRRPPPVPEAWRHASLTPGAAQAQPGQPFRADDDELLHLAMPALEGFGGEETALLGAS